MEIKKMEILEMAQPEINVYPFVSNPLAIMQCHQETEGWILNNFIQLCSGSEALNFYDFDYKCCPYLNIQRISKSYLRRMGIDIITFIVNSISAGYYIYLLVRRNKISAYLFESEENKIKDTMAHDLMIYGYNMDHQEFYIADNFVKGKYSFQKCTFKEMETAINCIEAKSEPRLGFKGTIELIEYYDKQPQNFILIRFLDSLRDYIMSKPTSLWNTMEMRRIYGSSKWYFGLDCYYYMIQRIRNMNVNNVFIQDLHLMWEHKKHLAKVVSYLLDQKYITDSTMLSQFELLANKALSARNLVLKYRITGLESIKGKVIDIYLKMMEEEKELIQTLINEIDKTMYEKEKRTVTSKVED